MLDYRLTVFDAASRAVTFDFEAPCDRDAVRLCSLAAGGQEGALWRDGRLLLRLEGFGKLELAPSPIEEDV